MISHQTITKKPKRITLLGLAQCFQKGDVIRIVFQNGKTVVAPVTGVEDETIVGIAGVSVPSSYNNQ